MKKLIWIPLLLIVGVILYASYKQLTIVNHAQAIEKITLTCRDECMDITNRERHVLEITNKKDVKQFVNAVRNASQVPGVLNYMVEFEMRWIYSDGTTEDYYLTLRNTRELGGLVVKPQDSHTGYSVSVNDANLLRDLLYE